MASKAFEIAQNHFKTETETIQNYSKSEKCRPKNPACVNKRAARTVS